MRYKNAIKDCLYNLDMRENNNAKMTFAQSEYYRGLIIGIASMLMYNGKTWDEAYQIILDNIPADHVKIEGLIE